MVLVAVKYFNFKYAALAALSAVVALCGTSFASEGVVFKGPRGKQKLQSPEKAEKKEYHYDPSGKIDPFEPFVLKKRKRRNLKLINLRQRIEEQEKVLAEMRKPKTELQRIELEELEITTIARNKKKSIAIVTERIQDEERRRGFFVEVGTMIGTNGGVIDEIVLDEKETAYGIQAIACLVIKEPFINKKGDIEWKTINMEMAHSSFK